MSDNLGNRMKMYEQRWTGKTFMPGLPIMLRLDGRHFHTLTKGLIKPYSSYFQRAMDKLTVALMHETGAIYGYTQSDEVSLVLFSSDIKSQVYFVGEEQKIVSCAAAFASVTFTEILGSTFFIGDTKGLATFDCKAWQVPDKTEAANTILWREFDATKNSISMLAQAHFSHNQLLGLNGKEMQDLLFTAAGINWNDQDARFKRGAHFQVQYVEHKFTVEELDKLPPKHEARTNPDLVVIRKQTMLVDMPPFSTVVNREDVIFERAAPKIA